MMRISPFTKAIGFAILSGALYGTLGLFGVLLQEAGLSIFQFLWGRFFLATLMLLPILVYVKQPIVLNKSSLSLFLSAFLFYSTTTSLFFYAIQYLGTGLSMVLFFTYPAGVIALESLVERKLPSPSCSFALLMVLAGLPLLLDKEAYEMSLNGLILGLLSAGFFALYFYLSQRYVTKMPVIGGTFWICLGNLAAYTAIFLFSGEPLPFYDVESIVPLLGIALIATVLPLYFVFRSLNQLNASQAALLSVAEPAVTLLIGYSFLEETINWMQFVGILLILASVLLLKQEKQKQKELA